MFTCLLVSVCTSHAYQNFDVKPAWLKIFGAVRTEVLPQCVEALRAEERVGLQPTSMC